MIINKQVTCPMFRKGGLPPRSTCENNLEEGQISLVTDAVDRQVPRCAYTVNEALCPRNRFTSGFEDAIRLSRYVDISEVRNISRTILVAEWTTNWELLAAPGDGICRSYLPVHGAKALGTSDHYNLNSVPVCPGKPCYRGGIYEKLTASDLSRWQSPARYSPSRLDWVGRNHGRCSASSPKDLRKSNFTYMDGHVECKSVYKTINPESYEWAERVYSIDCGNNHIK
jgi:prepilin-type processing-associated H-X9-DG protein